MVVIALRRRGPGHDDLSLEQACRWRPGVALTYHYTTLS
jgi:hypothetical protein